MKRYNEIRSFGMNSILCAEVSSSNDEILSLCIRYVDSKKQIREAFVDFIEMDRITGEALYGAISNFYQITVLLYKNCMGNAMMGHPICLVLGRGFRGEY